MQTYIIKFLLPALLILVSCTNNATPGYDAGLLSINYTVSEDDILNPERGFFTPISLPTEKSFQVVRDTDGNTLIRSYVRLDQYRDKKLPDSLLKSLDDDLSRARAAGIKVILRFSYNYGPPGDAPLSQTEPDASEKRILSHIKQLTPLFQKHGDILPWVEAGFIGAWGEWHHSTHDLDESLKAKRTILEALLEALPPTTFVQLRYPSDIRQLVGTPLSWEDVLKANQRARIGHHNDCFLASNNDQRTYNRDGVRSPDREQADIAELGRFAPVGGETCELNPPRTDCKNALEELERLRFTELNRGFNKGVLQQWKEQGCTAEIRRRLGYRLVLEQASIRGWVQPGGTLQLTLQLRNQGYTAPVHMRPVIAILDGPERYLFEIPGLDPRRWEPGKAIKIDVDIGVPADARPGVYRLALWLPDAAPSLRDDPRYAIRFANVGTWDGSTGWNILLDRLHIDPRLRSP